MKSATIELGDSFLGLATGQIRDQFVFVEGPRGTGKTRAILSVLLMRALAHPGSRILLGRSTRTRLTQTVLVTLEQQVFPAFGMSVPGGANRENRSEYALPGGSVFVLVSLDDLQRSQSAEYSWIYVAEGTEVTNADDVLSLSGSLRQAGAPFTQCIVDCNPGPPGHWLNQLAVDVPPGLRRVESLDDYQRVLAFNSATPPEGKIRRIITRLQDNPRFFDARAWRLTGDGETYLAGLTHLRGHLRRRWLDGDWVAAEGTVYPEFDDTRHVITPFEVPADWPIYVGLDPGYDHPCAILWLAVAPNGCMYVIDELYRGGLSIPEHAKAIRSRNVGRTIHRYYADPQHAFSMTAQSPKSIASQMRECGLSFSPWPRSTDVAAMVEGVRTRLNEDRLKVFAPCTNTIGEFQSWAYKRSAKGEMLSGDDQFEDRNNHALDVVKGVVAANPGRQRDSIQIVV